MRRIHTKKIPSYGVMEQGIVAMVGSRGKADLGTGELTRVSVLAPLSARREVQQLSDTQPVVIKAVVDGP